MLGRPAAAATHVAEWMLEAALATTSAGEAFGGMVERLRHQGIQIDRGHIAYTTLHPLNRGAGATWNKETGLEIEDYSYDRDQVSAGWYDSPIFYMVQNGITQLRRRLNGPAAMLDFPLLEGFARDGLSDYFLQSQPFDSFVASLAGLDGPEESARTGLATSFATARPDGFTDGEIEILTWLLRPLAMMVKMADQRQVAMNLAQCYIGREAGPRVLKGAIRRGDFDSTEAVVWLCDLRASTELAASLPPEEYIETINEFFECTAGAVEHEDGETLTYIGDGALAIFPIERLGEGGARRAAWKAALRAKAALADLNTGREASGKPMLNWGIALHAGRLEYGNIGSRARHTWSVIGTVVNETARLEGATKVVGEPIVASRSFIDGLSEDWRPMGRHDFKGVPAPFEVFAPPAAETSTIEEVD